MTKTIVQSLAMLIHRCFNSFDCITNGKETSRDSTAYYRYLNGHNSSRYILVDSLYKLSLRITIKKDGLESVNGHSNQRQIARFSDNQDKRVQSPQLSQGFSVCSCILCISLQVCAYSSPRPRTLLARELDTCICSLTL